MKIATYVTQSQGLRIGLLDSTGGLRSLAGFDGFSGDPRELLEEEGWDARVREVPVEQLSECPRDAELGPPQPSPSKIVAVGLNYRDHCRESGYAIPAQPVLFAKWPSAISGPTSAIQLPVAGCAQPDYEVELAAVIARTCRHVRAPEALSFVGGYTIANDVSARDAQDRDGQWTLAKSYDSFCPMGPSIVTADEIDDVQNLAIRCLVNGETRQESNTAEMIFSVAELIAYVSEFATLRPGDIILTGTPAGVGLGSVPPQWLNLGDQVVCEIEGLGAIHNTVTPDDIHATASVNPS